MTSATPQLIPNASAGPADPIVCHCHQVRESEVRAVIERDSEDGVEGVGQRLGAGTGCGACRCKVQRLLAGLPINCGPCGFCTGCGTIKKLCTCEPAEPAVAA